MKKTGFWEGAFAVMAGTVIGLLVALSVNHWFWWIGLLVGSLIGYLAVDLRQVASTASTAWHAVISWHPNWDFWKKFAWGMLLGFNAALSITAIVTLAVLITNVIRHSYSANMWTGALWFLGSMGMFFALGFGSLLCTEDRGIKFENHDTIQGKWRYAFLLNPLFLLYALARLTIAGFVKIPGKSKKAAFAIGRFLRMFFILIHSKKRMLVALDTAITVTISYFAWHSLIAVLGGIFVGLIVFFIDYKLISVGILHVVPNGNK